MANTPPLGNLERLGFKVLPPELPDNAAHLKKTELMVKPVTVQTFFDRIPAELKALHQWVCWRYVARDGKWDKVPFHPEGTFADTTNRATWSSFEAVTNFAPIYDGIGFVLAPHDGFGIIDLDDKPGKPATQEERNQFRMIHDYFGTYCELSVSGTGMHIVFKGKLPEGGRRKGNIEIYDSGRYMTFTGNTDVSTLSWASPVTPIMEITECQPELDYLLSKIGIAITGPKFGDSDIDVPETKSMDQIWNELASHSNKEKFLALWNGDWQSLQLGDGSQSVADASLIEFLRFSGATIEQARTMFRSSKLYRTQAQGKHPSYLMRTIRKAYQIGYIEQLSAMQSRMMAEKMLKTMKREEKAAPEPTAPAELEYPPGMVGNLARMFYSQAHLPSQSIAIAAALAFMAGTCGLVYQTPTNSGLNIYAVIIAPSGLGKDAANNLPSVFWRTVATPNGIPGKYENLRNPFYKGELASGVAIHKTLAHRRYMLAHFLEIGNLIIGMGNPRDTTSASIAKAFLNFYQSSAAYSSLGGMNYSNKDNNLPDPGACAFSMLGEVTPGVLFANLHADSADNGLLSRIDFIQVNNERPLLNRDAMHEPWPQAVQWAEVLFEQLNTCTPAPVDPKDPDAVHPAPTHIFVQIDSAANAMIESFELYCKDTLNAKDEGFLRQSYSRMHLKAIKYASLLAVADNPMNPVISELHTRWAINFLISGAAMFEKRVEAGDVGNDDHSRENVVQRACIKFMEMTQATVSEKCWERDGKFKQLGVISTSYLSRYVSAYAAFKNHPQGKTIALKGTLEHLVSCGVLHKLDKQEALSIGVAAQAQAYRYIGKM